MAYDHKLMMIRLYSPPPMPQALLLRCLFLQLVVVVVLISSEAFCCHGFSSSATTKNHLSTYTVPTSTAAPLSSTTTNNSTTTTNNNILILDHINLNHERGRHDLVHGFYGSAESGGFLQCVDDPRKAQNIAVGRKTLWSNIGLQQFHLPEGTPHAQQLQGCITLVYPSLRPLLKRYHTMLQEQEEEKESSSSSSTNTTTAMTTNTTCLQHSQFHVQEDPAKTSCSSSSLLVTDPWGTRFRIEAEEDNAERDRRGVQPGGRSEGVGIRDITLHVPLQANLAGIGRFYRDVLGAELVLTTDQENAEHHTKRIQIRMGPYQTLTFLPHPDCTIATHVDLRPPAPSSSSPEDDDDENAKADTTPELENYGIHLSLYVADFVACYERAAQFHVTYVNTRFRRRAYTLDDAKAQCMFRCLNIVDPLQLEAGPILQLEHEIRSVVNPDGTKYKSCPFDEIPKECVIGNIIE